MVYLVYRSSVEVTRKLFEDNKNKTLIEVGQETKKLIRQQLIDLPKNKSDKMLNSPMVYSAIVDSQYHQDGSPTLFLEDQKLVDVLTHSKFDIRMDEIKFPYRIFSVAVPENLRINGLKIPSFLVAHLTIDEQSKMVEKELEFECIPAEHRRGKHSTLLILSSKKDMQVRFLHVPEEDYNRAFDDDYHREVSENYEHLVQKLEKDESQILKICFRLAARLVVYMHAFPEKVVEGLPKKIKIGGGSIDLKTSKMISLPESIRSSPSAHFRSSHFRMLRHEKFHRNPDGSIRCIFIPSTMVKGKIEAKTVLS